MKVNKDHLRDIYTNMLPPTISAKDVRALKYWKSFNFPSDIKTGDIIKCVQPCKSPRTDRFKILFAKTDEGVSECGEITYV